MSVLRIAFKDLALLPLAAVSARPDISHLPDTLSARRGIGYDIDFDNALELVTVDFRDKAYLSAAYSGDAGRFVRAATQTIHGLADEVRDGRMFPWAMVKLYYSAYYAGHALLRLQGKSLSFLNGKNLHSLKQLQFAAATPAEFTLKGGQHLFSVLQSGSALSVKKTDSADGGAHEVFWKVMKANLATIGEAALASNALSQTESQSVFRKLAEAESAICSKGANGGNWLSIVRNEIQYRHGHNTWPPSNTRSKERNQIARIIENWKADPMSLQIENSTCGSLGLFASAAVFFVSLMRLICTWMSEISSAGKRCYVFAAGRIQ